MDETGIACDVKKDFIETFQHVFRNVTVEAEMSG
jgi:hypothetical protein